MPMIMPLIWLLSVLYDVCMISIWFVWFAYDFCMICVWLLYDCVWSCIIMPIAMPIVGLLSLCLLSCQSLYDCCMVLHDLCMIFVWFCMIRVWFLFGFCMISAWFLYDCVWLCLSLCQSISLAAWSCARWRAEGRYKWMAAEPCGPSGAPKSLTKRAIRGAPRLPGAHARRPPACRHNNRSPIIGITACIIIGITIEVLH